MTEKQTHVRVLLERHLIDLQLQDAPEQYLIGRVLAYVHELEARFNHPTNPHWRLMARLEEMAKDGI